MSVGGNSVVTIQSASRVKRNCNLDNTERTCADSASSTSCSFNCIHAYMVTQTNVFRVPTVGRHPVATVLARSVVLHCCNGPAVP